MKRKKDSQLRIGVLASGRGTSLDSLIVAIKNQTINAIIALIISDKIHAQVLAHKQKYGIETKYIKFAANRAEHEHAIDQAFRDQKVDLILLVGYQRILSKEFIMKWQNRIINIHPSLLPAFAGLVDLDLHCAVLAAKIPETGCTVHLVTEKVDAGQILLQKCCAVEPNDTPETLKVKVQSLEKEALVEVIRNFKQIFRGIYESADFRF